MSATAKIATYPMAVDEAAKHEGKELPDVLGRIGKLEVCMARDASLVAAAQSVRFRVFYDELGASRRFVHSLEQKDADLYDDHCDHLLVLDRSIDGPDQCQVVGTYRLLRHEPRYPKPSYCEQEFSLKSLMERHGDKRFLELGRSCVLPQYRNKRIVELLWQGIWAYSLHHHIDVMSGCASFPGIYPAAHAECLSFLAHNLRASPQWDVSALPDRYYPMDLMPSEAVNMKRAVGMMPPLLKGYMRLGARIGDGCVIDRDFCTTDVFVVLPVSEISRKYIDHYGQSAQRYAA